MRYGKERISRKIKVGWEKERKDEQDVGGIQTRMMRGKYKKGEVLNNPILCSHTAINVTPEGRPTPLCSKTKPGLMRVSVVHK